MAAILLVDDDEDVASLMEDVLRDEGYEVRRAPTLFRARGLVERDPPDAIILDRTLPDGDGLDFCLWLKKSDKTSAIPVLFLSAAEKSAAQKAKGLDAGADDYLSKPFDPAELRARVRALLRRAGSAPVARRVLAQGPLRLDLDARRAFLGAKELDLSQKEFDLLKTFLERPDKVLSRESLIQLAWGPGKELEVTQKSVDVAMSHLRRKLGSFGDRISSVRGVGFRFDSMR